MGIRFYCPNGHKLNVKDKLAGKRGVCPHCEVKLLIPLKSTRPSSREEREQQHLAANANGNPNDFDVFADDQGTAEIAISYDESGQMTAATLSSTLGQLSTTAFDDPSVVWYVQLNDGQRFGPATLDIVRDWVNERRIAPNMLVWREGWQDWVEARHVFPEIEQVFANWKAKKSQTNAKPPVAEMVRNDDVIEKHVGISIPLVISVLIVIAAFGGVLYFLLKP